MKYIDADQLRKELNRWKEFFLVEDGKNLPADFVITRLETFISRQEREVIPNDEILRKAERDLFNSYESAAVEEAKRRYTSPYAPECYHLISTYDIITRVQTAFVEGVIWKENEEIKEEKK